MTKSMSRRLSSKRKKRRFKIFILNLDNYIFVCPVVISLRVALLAKQKENFFLALFAILRFLLNCETSLCLVFFSSNKYVNNVEIMNKFDILVILMDK